MPFSSSRASSEATTSFSASEASGGKAANGRTSRASVSGPDRSAHLDELRTPGGPAGGDKIDLMADPGVQV